MKTKRTGGGLLGTVAGSALPVLLFVVVMVAFVGGVGQASEAESNEALRIAEESIQRAVISCYSIEGSYPESFEYVRDNYHLSIDESKYTVHYDIFASNMMPDITVIRKGGGLFG